MHQLRITANSPLPSLCRIRHNDGAEWGYSGSGPAQLALALLADATGDDELAQRHYQRFKREVVSGFERDRFLITQAEIRCWLASVLAGPDDGS